MLHKIPLQAIPNQKFSIQINNQEITISLATRHKQQLYATVSVNGEKIVDNRLCLNIQPLISVDYLPIKGNLFFIDMEGQDDPHYSGLGTRFILIYSEL
ncbi:hypothetical protein EV694_1683 [Volucribacter psittacicida]|uniref:Cyanophage baseplate Pam3 plug gp18 domain-containing protein n=1 Tax=Volucribacter psittacicida TaxID=203482 RepID=A0A4R1FRE8_9PAST|nr:hypothetical protein [Volucribacter psittacicida]TCJ96132.1 hypothetical protein EV694_1683 [Volucribacter psittacicida]